jgi:hypothetical protein
MPDTQIPTIHLENLKKNKNPKSINRRFGSAYSGMPDWYRIAISANFFKKNIDRNPHTPVGKKIPFPNSYLIVRAQNPGWLELELETGFRFNNS